MEMFFNTAGS